MGSHLLPGGADGAGAEGCHEHSLPALSLLGTGVYLPIDNTRSPLFADSPGPVPLRALPVGPGL